MTYKVIWSEPAIDQAAGFLKDDPDGVRQLFAAVDILADDPRPSGTAENGTPDKRRLRAGRYRLLHNVSDATATVVVIHAGRLG